MKLAKRYQPSLYEADIYALWEKLEAFKPSGKGSSYSLVVPPPNANGVLHIGHALSFALQDIAARYHRSKGEKVLFVPGSDHAGFETQVVFERQLEKHGKSRFDYSREGLYNEIFEFVATNRQGLENQIRRLGASVDWSHYSFTLDDPIVKQAYATFRSMWNEGLIYRGERLINFCTFHGTAFADIEVDYQDVATFLWHIRYPLVDGSGELLVATTRPETLFGDTAVAVNPNDARYKAMIGKTIKLPLTQREIPIIADEYVDPEFGTGAVKITPAHDPNDYEMAKRHDLPFVTVIGFDGHFTHLVPEKFHNLNVIEGREAVVAELRSSNFLADVVDYTHSVGHCYKCGTIIQPLLKDQWFVDIKPLAAPAIKALNDSKINFLPKTKQQQLISYLSSIRDWNISRQIAWGIPIPAFQNEEDSGDWIYDERVDQEVISVNNKLYRRDPDVFDTWFSSSSWPYATLGYPDAQDFKDFYPLSLMESGFDILMPWVSRMLMLGIYVTGRIPFKTVYLHGLVMDAQGQKMSKSKGNVVDPMGVIDDFGADALRIGVIVGQSAGNNQPYVVSKVIAGRNFCNKLWNIARYIESQIDEQNINPPVEITSEADNWILYRYQLTTDQVTQLMDNYRFAEAYDRIYHFIWDDLADWYIEATKADPNLGILLAILKASLTLVHPFVPFLSETIWQTLELDKASILSGQQIIKLPLGNPSQAAEFETIKNLIVSIRSILKPLAAKNIALYYQDEPLVGKFATVIKQLAQLKAVEITDQGQGIAVLGTNLNCWLDISQELIDGYVSQLTDKISQEQATIKALQARLNNPGYVKQAPAKLVNESREQLIESEHILEGYLMEKLRYKN